MKGRRAAVVITATITAAALLLPLVVTSPYWLGVLVTAWIFAIGASGQNVVSGYIGEMSLAHHGFFALGAYTSTLVAIHADVTPLIGILAAVALTAALGLAVGGISFRAVGAYFAIATFGFGQLIGIVINGWESLTRGVLGLASPPLAFTVFGRAVEWSTPRAYYYVTLVGLIVTLAVIAVVLRSRLGRSAVAVREHPDLAAVVGVNVYRTQVLMFAISAGFAGLAGAFYAHYIRFIASGLASAYYLVAFLIMVVFGGNGTLLGPALGALVFTVAPEFLRVTEQSRLVIFALLLLVFIMVSPRGVLPGIIRAASALTRRNSRQAPGSTPSKPESVPTGAAS